MKNKANPNHPSLRQVLSALEHAKKMKDIPAICLKLIIHNRLEGLNIFRAVILIRPYRYAVNEFCIS